MYNELTGRMESHVIHHNEIAPMTYAIEVERNTRGFNFTVKIQGGTDPNHIIDEMERIVTQLNDKYPQA